MAQQTSSSSTIIRLTKHERVKEKLRRQILEGAFAPGAKLPPDSQLYKRFNVHRLTVIRALTDLVQEGLIVRRRGSGTYVTGKNQAPPVVTGRMLNIGILWRGSVSPDRMLNSFLGVTTLGAIEALGLDSGKAIWPLNPVADPTRAIWEKKSLGIRVECLCESSVSNVRHPPLEEVQAGGFSGLLAVGILEDAFLDRLLQLGIPLVLADVLKERLNGKVDQIFVDPQQGYRQAVRHFADVGLKRIHFVGSQISLPAPSAGMSPQDLKAYRGNRVRQDPDSYLRFSAFRQAMDECELEVPEHAIHLMGPVLERIPELAERLAARPPESRPEAVVCHDSTQAEDLIRIFSEKAIQLQGAGAANMQAHGKALPICIDLKALGASGMDLLLSRIQRPGRPFHRVGVPMNFSPSSLAPVISRSSV